MYFSPNIQIKTTSPEKFRVRPSTGILAPGAGTTINVLLQHGQHMTLVMNKDKFLVMCMELKASSNLNTQEIAEIWKVCSIIETVTNQLTIFFRIHLICKLKFLKTIEII